MLAAGFATMILSSITWACTTAANVSSLNLALDPLKQVSPRLDVDVSYRNWADRRT